MSDDEEYQPKAKEIDINVNISREDKKKEVTDKDAQAIAEQLSEIIGIDVQPAVTVSEYKEQKNKLRLELAKEIGQSRERRSERKAHERTTFPTATGQAKLSGEQATGEGQGWGGESDDLLTREFNSYESMINHLREREKAGDVESRRILGKLYKKAIKQSGRRNAEAVFMGEISKIGIKANPEIHDEEYKEDVKEKIKKRKSEWKETD